MRLKDIIDLNYLQQLQDSFAAASKLTTIIVDSEGEHITRPSNWGGFCRFFQDSGAAECREKTQEMAVQAGKSRVTLIYACPHMNMTTAAVPIFLEDEYLGCWIISQLPLHPISLEIYETVPPILGLDHDTAARLFDALPKFNRAEFTAIFDFVRQLTNTITSLGHANRQMAQRDRELQEVSEEMAARDKVLTRFINSDKDALYIADYYTGELLMVNDAYCRLVGQTCQELIGRKCWELAEPGQDTFCSYCPRHRLLDDNGKPTDPYTWENYKPRRRLWMRCTHQAIEWAGARAAHMVSMQDITHERALYERMEHLAFHDMQSGLPNIHKLTMLAEKYRDHGIFGKYDMLCLDLSALGMISDAYGRETGDKMQKEILQWLTDTYAPEDSLYHLGRYEFGILLRKRSTDKALELAKKLRERFEEPWQVRIKEHWFSYICSVHLSILKSSEAISSTTELSGLLDRTFDAGRKAQGIFVYDDELDKNNREHIQLDLSLKHCIEQDMQGFDIHFQPIVELASGTWKGLECLCRWRRPEHGVVPPEVFIHEAEGMGLINVLGLWVLENAVKRCKELELDLLEGFFLSVNLSPLQLMDVNFAEKVISILERYTYPGPALNLEITESAEMTFNSFTRQIIDKLRSKGISLALDDFGTGYSSFNNLKHLPVNYLKTEREFITGIEEDTYMQYFFYVMSEIAHANGMKFIAEGVETEEQLKVAKNNGADYIQGYFFSRPIPSGDLHAHLPNFKVPYQSYVPLTGEAVNIRQWLSGHNAYELTPNLFKLLNECMQILLSEKEVSAAFHDVLEIVGEHFGVARAFAFVLNADMVFSEHYEWCAPDIPSHQEILPGIDAQRTMQSLLECFKGEGMIVASDISKLHHDLYQLIEPLGVKSIALLPMWDDNKLIGFAGFDKTEHYEWSGEEIIMLWNMAMIMANSLKREKLTKEVVEKQIILHEVLHNTGLNSYMTDLDNYDVLWVNDTMRNAYPFGKEMVGCKCYEVLSGRSSPCPNCAVPQLLASSEPIQVRSEVTHPFSGLSFISYSSIIQWKAGKKVHICHALDVTNQQKAQRQIEELAATDLQTGALNRTTILQKLANMLDSPEHPEFSVAFVNIDKLGRINAAYGHEAGDRILIATSKALRACLQRDDLIGRIAGDEFLVIMPGCARSTAKVRMMQARNYLSQVGMTVLEGKASFSFGIVSSKEAEALISVGSLCQLAYERMLEQREADRVS